MPSEILPGTLLVTFISGKTDILDVVEITVDTYAHPMFLVTEDGKMYNYNNVLSTVTLERKQQPLEEDMRKELPNG